MICNVVLVSGVQQSESVILKKRKNAYTKNYTTSF